MNTQTPEYNLLMDLDARHEQLLAQLDDLDRRVEKALVECQACRVRPADTDLERGSDWAPETA